MPTCCDCNQSLTKTQFSKNQLRKDPNSRRCKACVQVLTLQEETDQQIRQNQETNNDPPKEAILIEESLPLAEKKEVKDTILDEIKTEELNQKLNCVEVASKPDDVSSCTEQSSIVVKSCGGGLPIDKETSILAVHVVTNITQEDQFYMKENPSQVSMESQITTIDPGDLQGEVEEKKEKDPLEEIPNLVSVPSITLVDAVCDDKMNSPHVEDEMTLVLDSTEQEMKVATTEDDQGNDAAVVTLDATHCPKAETSVTEDSSDQSASTRVRVGICAMDKKARSKPMVSV